MSYRLHTFHTNPNYFNYCHADVWVWKAAQNNILSLDNYDYNEDNNQPAFGTYLMYLTAGLFEIVILTSGADYFVYITTWEYRI